MALLISGSVRYQCKVPEGQAAGNANCSKAGMSESVTHIYKKTSHQLLGAVNTYTEAC